MPKPTYLIVCNSLSPKQTDVGCCGDKGASSLIGELRVAIQELGLEAELIVRESPCMNLCATGISLKVLPGNICYGRLKSEDISDLLTHLINGQVLDRLKVESKNRLGF